MKTAKTTMKTTKTRLSAIRAMAKLLALGETPEQSRIPTFGPFCRSLGLDIEDWTAYRQAKRDQMGRKGRPDRSVSACNPSAWEALAWIQLGRPQIV